MIRSLAALLLIGLAVVAAAGAGAAAVSSSVDTWYPSLQRPAWAPPSWVFAPVWTLLYAGMVVSAWLVWQRAGWASLATFFFQLFLNALWPLLFFGLRSPGWAMLEIWLLWLAVLLTLVVFRPIRRTAAWLLAPYLAWVGFAALLNTAIWMLN